MQATDKGRVTKNATTSILLKAPLQVRDIILRFVLGDRIIHIKYATQDPEKISWPKPKDADEKAAEGGGPLLCLLCCWKIQNKRAMMKSFTALGSVRLLRTQISSNLVKNATRIV